MRLDEYYYILTKDSRTDPGHIYFTCGKAIDENFAICKTEQGRYSVTHIETGCRFGGEYSVCSACSAVAHAVIAQAWGYMKNQKEAYEKQVSYYKDLFEKWMAEGNYRIGGG